MSQRDQKTPGFTSPPCFAHELEFGGQGYEVNDAQTAIDVARWRQAERQRLIEHRLAVPAKERQQAADRVAARLDELIALAETTLDDTAGSAVIVSVYWPFRGELNLRDWMQQAVSRGVRIALPVVVEKAQPLIFREWLPDCRLEPGVWNIPVPLDGARLQPTHVIAPLVGFDADGYRLGYGGGFFDRTLADMHDQGLQPTVVGVGHSVSRIATIFPQPHDIPMNIIITDGELLRVVTA